ncbi:MAG: adenylate kinase [Oscillospiraceae bacterium]|jgi:adenylate kinase|nr:adenylate kinase [Oscillospiraceae bacterium]
MKILFLGPPGAGKGTHASIVASQLNIPQISTGAILREAMSEETALGKTAKDFVDKGLLVPDDIIIDLVRERIARDDCKDGYILDGFPRTVAQAESLDGISQLDAIINIELDDESIVKRLSGRRVCKDCGATYHLSRLGNRVLCEQCSGDLIQRNDDKAETVLNRLTVYHSQTAPLVEYYKGSGRMYALDGALPIEEGGRILSGILQNVHVNAGAAN